MFIKSYLNSALANKIRHGSIPISATGSVQSGTENFATPFPNYGYTVVASVLRNANDDSPFGGDVRIKGISKTAFSYAFKGNAGGSYYIEYIAIGE